MDMENESDDICPSSFCEPAKVRMDLVSSMKVAPWPVRFCMTSGSRGSVSHFPLENIYR